MGIKPDAANHRVITASHLTTDIDWLQVEQLPMGDHELTLRHDGLNRSKLTNTSKQSLEWEVWFYGDYPTLIVDGQSVPAEHKLVNGQRVSYVTVTLAANSSSEVRK